MSAFFVTEKTIHDVVTVMRPALMSGDENANEFGRELWRMNIEALRQRYRLDGTDELAQYNDTADRYVFVESTDVTEAQKLKSLNCLLYQCCEGDVDTTDLYKRCDRFSSSLADLLSGGRQVLSFGEHRPFVKGYDEAEWDRS